MSYKRHLTLNSRQPRSFDRNERNNWGDGQAEHALINLPEPRLRPIMVPVTTRGVGVATTQLAYYAKQCRVNVPSIYALYRVFLGLLEAKVLSLKSHFSLIPRFTDSVYQHVGMRSSELQILRTCNIVPVAIQKIIDAVGIVTDKAGKVYYPVIAKNEDANGALIPCPLNVTLTSLRQVVKMLADEETPLAVRKAFEKNNPIPGTQWSNHVLQNPDDIIAQDYDYEEGLPSDIFRVVVFIGTLQRHAPEIVGGPLNAQKIGRASLFVSNEMGTLRCPNRNTGEELDAYYDRCVVEGNISQYSSPVELTNAELSEGKVIMLGEQPTVATHSLYVFRDECQHAFFIHK